MKLIIVRHGETEWNKESRLQGEKDVPLSKAGLQQAKMLAKRLSKSKIDVIYSSLLKRAARTTEEIKRFHRSIRITKDKELNEMSWGIWEGFTWDRVKKEYPQLYIARKKDKFNFKVPRGESPKMLKSRITRVLNKIIKNNKGKNVLIVSHGGVNRTILGILLRWGNKKIVSTIINNASITIVSIKNSKSRMSLFDSQHHLKNGSLPY